VAKFSSAFRTDRKKKIGALIGSFVTTAGWLKASCTFLGATQSGVRDVEDKRYIVNAPTMMI
jgi:hypothetical protein